MKQTQRFLIPLFALLVAASISGTSFADLNANDIVSRFNAMNGGTGARFTVTSPDGLNLLTSATGYENVDISAYTTAASTGGTTSGNTWFKSFCVEPSVAIGTTSIAKLNYSGGQTKNSSGVALVLGAAYLYKQYATGNLAGFTYPGTSGVNGTLSNAIRVLLGYTQLTNWSTNTFLNHLLTINSSKTYWTASYDPGKYYNEIGEYSVFVMNMESTTGINRQDFMYLAKATNSNDVPEPASILFWSFTGLGLAGSSWARKRRMKKLALN